MTEYFIFINRPNEGAVKYLINDVEIETHKF